MRLPYILQFNVPFRQLLGGEIEAVALVGDVMVLAEGAAQIAAGEEDCAGPVMALYARLCGGLLAMTSGGAGGVLAFAEVGGYHIDLYGLRADEADACALISVHAAEAWAEVAIAEVGVRCGALL